MIARVDGCQINWRRELIMVSQDGKGAVTSRNQGAKVEYMLELTTEELNGVSGGYLSSLATMSHEMKKAVVNNLRG
jgi:hypothetical protein